MIIAGLAPIPPSVKAFEEPMYPESIYKTDEEQIEAINYFIYERLMDRRTSFEIIIELREKGMLPRPHDQPFCRADIFKICAKLRLDNGLMRKNGRNKLLMQRDSEIIKIDSFAEQYGISFDDISFIYKLDRGYIQSIVRKYKKSIGDTSTNFKRGKDHANNCLMTEDQVRFIRKFHKKKGDTNPNKYFQCELAVMHNTSAANIYRIVNKISWKHVY